MDMNEVGLGDTVRLRNGETVVVESKFTSYTDAEGEHEGPFIGAGPHGHDHYLLADVLEVVAPNPRRCRFCGEGVTANNDETDFCRNCFYTGRADEERRGDLLYRLRCIDGVEDAGIWHTGGGCFMLAVSLADERRVYLTDGDAGLPEPGESWGFIAVAPDESAWDEWDESRLKIEEGSFSEEYVIAAVEKVAATRPRRAAFREGTKVYRVSATKTTVPFAEAPGYRLTVPASVAREIGPDQEFTVEQTDEGLLYRKVAAPEVVDLDGERQYREELACGRDPRD